MEGTFFAASQALIRLSTSETPNDIQHFDAGSIRQIGGQTTNRGRFNFLKMIY